MALTETTIIPKTVIGEDLAVKIIAVAWDSSYPTGGEEITCTDFSRVYSVMVGGNDTLADNGYIPRPVFTYTTAPSTTEPKISVWWNSDPGGVGGANCVDVEFTNGGSLAALGKTMLVITGR